MKIKMTDDFLQVEGDIPFVCSFSDSLRLMVRLIPNTRERFAEHTKEIVEHFDNDPDLCKSLKTPMASGYKSMRQVDLKDDEGKILFKCFMQWDEEANHWHVYLEGAEEDFWEDELKSVEPNNN